MNISRLNMELLRANGVSGKELMGWFVPVSGYARASDNGDISLAVVRAINAGVTKILLPACKVDWKTAVVLTSKNNISIAGFKGLTYVQTPVATEGTGAALITALRLVSCSGITLSDFHIDGGYRSVISQKRAVRLVRIQDCNNIKMQGFTASHAGDWCISYERCSFVNVFDYEYHYGEGSSTLWGGRDGMHFIDCSHVIMDRFHIISGDDCVGCTVETVGQSDITISNGFVHSMLASGVIFNEEGSAVFNTRNIKVSNITAIPDMGNFIRNIVRVYSINANSEISDVVITGIKGKSYAEGVWASGTSAKTLVNLSILDIQVEVQTGAHGCRVQRAQNVTLSGSATTLGSDSANFDGWHIEDVDQLTAVGLYSKGAAFFGVNLLRVSNFTLDARTKDCGFRSFASNNGGSLLINGCTNGMISGQYLGAMSTTYNGLSPLGTNTNIRYAPGIVFTAVQNTKPRGISNLDTPDVYAALNLNAGTMVIGASYGCSVAYSGGVFTVTFTDDRLSTYYLFNIAAYHNGALRDVQLVSTGTTSLAFKVLDRATGADATACTRIVVTAHQS